MNDNDRVLTVKDVINKLKNLPMDKEIIVFAEGKIYPILAIQISEIDQLVEIGCGWANLDYE